MLRTNNNEVTINVVNGKIRFTEIDDQMLITVKSAVHLTRFFMDKCEVLDIVKKFGINYHDARSEEYDVSKVFVKERGVSHSNNNGVSTRSLYRQAKLDYGNLKVYFGSITKLELRTDVLEGELGNPFSDPSKTTTIVAFDIAFDYNATKKLKKWLGLA